jgi:hypothetical protein
MPKSQSYFATKDANIVIYDQQMYPRDVSGTTNTVEIDFGAAVEAFYAFTTGKLSIQGQRTDKLTIKGYASKGSYELRRVLEEWDQYSGSRWVKIILPDTTSGGRIYWGEFVIGSLKLSPNAEENKPMMYEASLEPFGDVSRRWID